MSNMHKYHSKYVFWDKLNQRVINAHEADKLRSGKQDTLPKHIRRFDSLHEFKVYLELIRIYGIQRIKTQVHVNILPRGLCFPRGKTWKVDFAITESDDSHFAYKYVEAKGLITREFIYTLACLETYKPNIFHNLHLVFVRSIPIENNMIKSLTKSHWNNHMLTLKDLQKLRQQL